MTALFCPLSVQLIKENPDGEEEVKVDTFRVIGIRRLKGECLVRRKERSIARRPSNSL